MPEQQLGPSEYLNAVHCDQFEASGRATLAARAYPHVHQRQSRISRSTIEELMALNGSVRRYAIDCAANIGRSGAIRPHGGVRTRSSFSWVPTRANGRETAEVAAEAFTTPVICRSMRLPRIINAMDGQIERPTSMAIHVSRIRPGNSAASSWIELPAAGLYASTGRRNVASRACMPWATTLITWSHHCSSRHAAWNPIAAGSMACYRQTCVWTADGRVHRELAWASFRNATEPVPLPDPDSRGRAAAGNRC